MTRCFFFILDRQWSLPGWAHRALQYAPVAALMFFWRRSVLLTIAAGMAVYLPLHLVLGW